MTVGVCALDVVRGVVARGCGSCSDRGDGVADVIRPDAVRVWLPMVWKLLRSGRWCGGRCGVSARGIEVAQFVSEVRPAYQGIKYYIYNVLVYFQTK